MAFFSGSNPNLKPETSESKTLGVVWSPGFLEGLNVSLDWWKIRIEDTIVADSPTQILNDCYIQGDAQRCTIFTRDPVRGYVNSLSFASINAGYREAEGYDFDLSYRLGTGIGDFSLLWQTTYTSRDEIKTDTNPNSLPQQLVGWATSPGLVGTLRIRSNASLTWSHGPWSATWGARYYVGPEESASHPRAGTVGCDPAVMSEINAPSIQAQKAAIQRISQ
ncbi:TonB-dependent receptor domain-containing protein, partial [Pseudoxanthomonas taiwanensis]|uniref:TonB-dependent receptor domain-containing protein n=1 Tax=Pseudoxanthomonas taiwanensis TaxID=176598 RepID=UPI001FE31B54